MSDDQVRNLLDTFRWDPTLADEDVREAGISHAREVLVRMGDKAVDGLIKALGDPDDDVRLNAVFVLGRIGLGRAVPGLKAALADQNARIRRAAVYALGRIGSDAALTLLVEVLDDPVLGPCAEDAIEGAWGGRCP